MYTALGTVRDPELDQPVTTLGFVSSCTVTGEGAAQVRLRLPTYFCAPNFAFLMVADAYDAVTAVPGVSSAEVILDDHFASDAINAGVAARAGFAASFDRRGNRRARRPSAPLSSVRRCWPAPTWSAAPSSTTVSPQRSWRA